MFFILLVLKSVTLRALQFYLLAVRDKMTPKSIGRFKYGALTEKALVVLNTFVGGLGSKFYRIAALRTIVLNVFQ